MSMTGVQDPKGLMSLMFKCPECGGKYFGTSNCTKDDEKGHCHSYLKDGTQCRFTWVRSSEDDDVFVNRI